MTSRIARGDEAAFREFYEAYADRLFRYLIVLTGGQESLAQDALQLAMVRVVRYIRPFERHEPLWDWLTTVTKTAFFDLLRKEKRFNTSLPLEESLLEQNVNADDSALVEMLRECLDELDTADRAVIAAVYFEAQSHDAVAQAYGTTTKAIESKVGRIRQKLRKAIVRKLNHERRT